MNLHNEIPLTRGKVALVDAEDYEWLMQWRWRVSPDGYAVRNSDYVKGQKRTTLHMHREIIKAPKGIKVDHRDRSTLYNWRSNLRLANDFESARNRGPNKNSASKYKGVVWMGKIKKWQAQIGIKQAGKRTNVYLGVFSSESDAAITYNEYAQRFHGAFAMLNEIAA